MLLAIDVGNSALKAAVFHERELVEGLRWSYADVGIHAAATQLQTHAARYSIDRMAISSVVPAVEEAVREAFDGLAVTRISSASRLPIRLAYDEPDRLGSDRIAAAVGADALARNRYGVQGPVVAVDAGTAVTLNVVDAQSTFLGGLIWAGPELVQWALHKGTAQLPKSTPGPVAVIATNPESAMRSAAEIGFVEGVRGMLQRIGQQLGARPFVIVTGGRAALLETEIEEIDAAEPYLVLYGVRMIAELEMAG